MLKELTAANIYIVCGHTDMRKSIDGLAAIIREEFDLDLFSDSLFLFCGRRRDRLKALLWEGDGFIMLYKRLEDGRFNWPRNEQEVRNLSREQFVWLLQGLSVDQPKAIKTIEGGIDFSDYPFPSPSPLYHNPNILKPLNSAVSVSNCPIYFPTNEK